MPLKKGAVFWADSDKLYVTNYPKYLKEGFFLQHEKIKIVKDTGITIEVTGKAKVYVASSTWYGDGGYDESLPRNGWETEIGEINLDIDMFTLNLIFSKSLNDKETQIVLPKTTTQRTLMLVIVVSICPG